MEYKIEEDKPIKKLIQITVPAEEVDASLAGSLAIFKDSVQLDGFRKGKAPASVIEKKFHNEIYREAKENLINVHINDILTKLELTPVSPIRMEGDDKSLEKGKEYIYTINFETLPQLTLPSYEGLKTEEEKVVFDDKEMNMVLERMQQDSAVLKTVDGNGPADDGQIATIDFEAYEDGELLKDFKASNFNLELGAKQALPEFEKIVKGIPVGHTAEETIKMPDDFIAENLAGKEIKFKITVHAIKEKILPELNNEFAKKSGFNSLEQLKEIIKMSYLKNLKGMTKAVAQRKLLDQLLKQSDFEVPPAMIDTELRFLLANQSERLERQGKSLKSLGKSLDELKEAFLPEATKMARDKVLLLNVAKNENLELSPEELQKNIYKDCLIHGENYQEVMKNLEESGFMFHLRDQMLCDKAMDLIYDRAEITEVEPKAQTEASPTDNTDAQDESESKEKVE